MRYWNPKTAAAHRIAEDALDTYGPEKMQQLMDALGPSPSPGSPVAPPRPQEGRRGTGADLDPRLLVKLSSLSTSDPEMYRKVMSELSMYASGRGESAGGGGGAGGS